jgi:hypothetical protein
MFKSETFSVSTNVTTLTLMGLIVLVASYADSQMGVIVGASLGVLGAVIGLLTSLKEAPSAPIRSFMIKSSLITAALALSFLVAFLSIPGWYRFLLFIPYGIALIVFIRGRNRRRTIGSHSRIEIAS